MRSDIATVVALGLSVCSVANAQSVPPTFSCYDPPEAEGQTNPLGEGMEDIVGVACCESLIVEGDILAGRQVVWDPLNCNYGAGDEPIAEAEQCRAHDTDGCRFCYDSCVGFAPEDICITCDDMFSTSSPTGSPTDFDTPAPASITTSTETEAPFGIFPDTPSPVAATAAPIAPTPSPVAATEAPIDPTPSPVDPTEAPAVPATPAPVLVTEAPVVEEPSDCVCVNSMSAEENAVLERRGKRMVCDETCVNGEDLVWGVMNCNYFALGQTCRACSDLCTDMGDGVWEDQDAFPCKPCSAI